MLCAVLGLALVVAGACSSMNKKREFDLDKYTKEVTELMPVLIGELGLTWEQQGQIEEILLDAGNRMADMSKQGPPQGGRPGDPGSKGSDPDDGDYPEEEPKPGDWSEPSGQGQPGGPGGPGGRGDSMAEGMAKRVLADIMPVLDRDQQKKKDWIELKLVALFKEVMPEMRGGPGGMGGPGGGGPGGGPR